MKPQTTVLNKLIAYARDNLMLDALDETYALNRLATLCGVKPEHKDVECEQSLDELFAELDALAPGVDKAAALDILLPLPHTVNYYFTDELDRNPAKAFDFLFELYAPEVSTADALTANGYTFYPVTTPVAARAVALPVGRDEQEYTPVNGAAKIGVLSCSDVITSDVTARMAAYAETYKGAIVKGEDNYYTAAALAVAGAPVKEQIKSGAVKVAALDYPVPALKVSGIAKNAVAREAASIVKAADAAGVKYVLACDYSSEVAFYIVFSNGIATDETFTVSDGLAACGVVGTISFAPVLPVLEKGTALSTDLFAYKSVYAAVGGVKHGNKAASALAAALAKMYTPVLAASASADEAKVKAIATEGQADD